MLNELIEKKLFSSKNAPYYVAIDVQMPLSTEAYEDRARWTIMFPGSHKITPKGIPQ